MKPKPAINVKMGIIFLCFGKEEDKDHIPITSDRQIMLSSTQLWARNSRPHKGKVVMRNGSAAQCMAQATEAVIPNWSNAADLTDGFI